MKVIKHFFAAMACLSLLAACGEASQAETRDPVKSVAANEQVSENSATDIQDVTWTLTSLNAHDPVADTKITLVLGADGSLSGNAGCNGYRGHYEFADGAELKINPAIVSTMRACAEEIMKQEYNYHQILGEVTSWSVTAENELSLKTDGDRVLLFTK